MEQAQLTLEGMKRGVRDSDVFLLLATQNVLTRWFCQQELLAAIDEGTPIQLLVEEDPRFYPFSMAGWQNFAADTPEDHAKICAAIEAALPNAVQHRRRDYEAAAMMQELLLRNGITLPSAVGPGSSTDMANVATIPLVYLIGCQDGHGGNMVGVLRNALNTSGRVNVAEGSQQALTDADKVLVLLSEGALQAERLEDIVKALEQDRTDSTDRIVMVCRTASEGWVFGSANPEVAVAPASVQQALNEHEAMTYRAPNEAGGSRHEFPALLRHLLGRLAPSSGATGAPDTRAAPVQTAQTVRQQLEASNQQLETANQQLEAVRQALAQGDTEKANQILSAASI